MYRKTEAQYYCLKINVLKWNKVECARNVEQFQTQLDALKEKKEYEEGKLAKHVKELQELEACPYACQLVMHHLDAACVLQ